MDPTLDLVTTSRVVSLSRTGTDVSCLDYPWFSCEKVLVSISTLALSFSLLQSQTPLSVSWTTFRTRPDRRSRPLFVSRPSLSTHPSRLTSPSGGPYHIVGSQGPYLSLPTLVHGLITALVYVFSCRIRLSAPVGVMDVPPWIPLVLRSRERRTKD